jgi:hypothetical protein
MLSLVDELQTRYVEVGKEKALVQETPLPREPANIMGVLLQRFGLS